MTKTVSEMSLSRRALTRAAALCLAMGVSACGVAYHSPKVQEIASDGAKVRVVPLTTETVLVANRTTYEPQALPAIFNTTAGSASSLRGAGALPPTANVPERRPAALETRLPPAVTQGPYKIGVGDVIVLATPSGAQTSVEQLSGLLAAQSRRQGYTVQDDGAIAIPDVGRVKIAQMTLEEAEAEIFRALVENQINPTFSLEIAEFNSKKVSIGGAVSSPRVASITLTPLYLDEALALSGGVTDVDPDYTTVRLYRQGALYQLPLRQLYAQDGLQRIQLIEGDSVFVDTEFQLDQAEAYFAEQIRLAEFKQTARVQALNELEVEVAIRRAQLAEARQNFETRLELGAVKQDYVYLTGEVRTQTRFALPFGQKATLADAIYDGAGGIPTETGNVRQIYVLRGSEDPREYNAVTAYNLDASNAANLLVATRFELRPNDVIFVAEQPVTRWGRVIDQITPSLVVAGVNQAAGN
ncbi:polysaccharide biosynthesis/export family protein [Rhodovulum sp. FJ3]|uniref:polysaccharide biosynthesis/export family protein n=1 Tax=Rhodovulum sp. FJ3 TaxID=3079053 RepID=UPI00293DF01C|nr:polysaccharide biosynthesis/export family protein [Rhodovulum sp. FJ3]MDV4167582.1 polysaccharide biosynthesis/export family protein [Rhodovulum sp. FJ3]